MANEQLTKNISKSEISTEAYDKRVSESKISGYFITEKGLTKLTDVINEVPTKYGMVLIKVLQEELEKRDY